MFAKYFRQYRQLVSEIAYWLFRCESNWLRLYCIVYFHTSFPPKMASAIENSILCGVLYTPSSLKFYEKPSSEGLAGWISRILRDLETIMSTRLWELNNINREEKPLLESDAHRQKISVWFSILCIVTWL